MFKVGDKVRRDARLDSNLKATSGDVVTVNFSDGQWLKFEEDETNSIWSSSCYVLAQQPKNSDIVFITTAEFECLHKRIAELEEALKIKEEWTPWNGGDCPVDPETKVHVKFQDGEVYKDNIANSLNWKHLGLEDHDIIAYRIVK